MKEHNKKPLCVICGRPVRGYGYCNKHYMRYKKYGNPMIVKKSNGKEYVSED